MAANPEINAACGKLLQKYLMASYAYYVLDVSVMPDEEYDKIAKLLLKYWKEFDHQHKRLISEADLEATTLYALRDSDYPLMVKGAAMLWIRDTKAKPHKEGSSV